MNTDLEELYQAVILDHSRRPRNFGEIPARSASMATILRAGDE
jgi:nitrogen fixation NifU-like protein